MRTTNAKGGKNLRNSWRRVEKKDLEKSGKCFHSLFYLRHILGKSDDSVLMWLRKSFTVSFQLFRSSSFSLVLFLRRQLHYRMRVQTRKFFTTKKMECETINHVKQKKKLSHRSREATGKSFFFLSLISGDKLKSFSHVHVQCSANKTKHYFSLSSFILRHASKSDIIWPRLTFSLRHITLTLCAGDDDAHHEKWEINQKTQRIYFIVRNTEICVK